MTPAPEDRGSRPILLPKGQRPPIRPADSVHSFRWSDLIRAYVHPAKIAIVEAMQVTNQPLSAKELTRMYSGGENDLSELAYHLRALAKIGLLKETHEAPVRGAREVFYFIDSDDDDSPL